MDDQTQVKQISRAMVLVSHYDQSPQHVAIEVLLFGRDAEGIPVSTKTEIPVVEIPGPAFKHQVWCRLSGATLPARLALGGALMMPPQPRRDLEVQDQWTNLIHVIKDACQTYDLPATPLQPGFILATAPIR